MIVMVEQETVTGSLRKPSEINMPSTPAPGPEVPSSPSQNLGAASPRFVGNTGKLYAEYLRREGRSPGSNSAAAVWEGTLPSRSGSQRVNNERALDF